MTLLTLGALFLIGLCADLVGRSTPMPRITVLLVSGVMIGPGGFGFVPLVFVEEWFPTLTQVALAMVGFLMGQKLTLGSLRRHGSEVVSLALFKVMGVILVVSSATYVITQDLALSLVVGGIAAPSAPTATFDVVHEMGSKGVFTDNLLNVVAIDDAIGLVLFSILLSVALLIDNGSFEPAMAIDGFINLFGSLVLGTLLGIPMAYLTGRLNFGQREGEPIQTEAIGFVLACAGAAVIMGLSPILAAMAMGSVVASLAKHHQRPFHAIEGIEWPFMILFFVLAGASLQLEEINQMGWLVLVYIVARGAGIYFGTFSGAIVANSNPSTRRWMGLAMMPQAGVALGMALMASQALPGRSELILALVLSTTIILELFSPLLTRYVLRRVETIQAEDN
jgi:Kef-type K+ transport system membrane component KefB